MAPQHLMLFFFLLLSGYTITAVTANDSTGFMRSLDREILEKKEYVSHFRFYWQDNNAPDNTTDNAGHNATDIAIVRALPQFNGTISFGLVRVFDNPLTSGPELSSKLLGRSQGFYVSTSETDLSLLMVMNFVLFEGRYNGSSITILGRNHASDKVREMPVIGGSGVFRFSKGYALSTTTSTKTLVDTIEYNVYVSHN